MQLKEDGEAEAVTLTEEQERAMDAALKRTQERKARERPGG
jgi:hypothetical protein